MALISFEGFGGIRLEADDLGSPDSPTVLLIHGSAQTRKVWAEAAEALVRAGRRVINLDLRGHGGSDWPSDGRYDLEAFVGDLRAVLSQMRSRPVVVTTTLSAWIATIALRDDGANLASGLVLADLPTQLDQENSHKLGEQLRARMQRGHRPAEWDLRLLDAFKAENMPERLSASSKTIHIPVLYVRGALNHLVTAEQAEAFVKEMPAAEFTEVGDASFLVAPDRLEIFNSILLDFLERKQPLAPPEFRSGSDSRTFRDALGCFATGVTVVTAVSDAGVPVGLTANSFTSVSLDPPLLLVCIANSAGTAPILRSAKTFAVNVLQIGQQPISKTFAGKNEERFASTAWHSGENGAPILGGSLSSFECRQYSVSDGGDHFILVGEVTKATFEPRRDPLLYFRGKYRRLHFA